MKVQGIVVILEFNFESNQWEGKTSENLKQFLYALSFISIVNYWPIDRKYHMPWITICFRILQLIRVHCDCAPMLCPTIFKVLLLFYFFFFFNFFQVAKSWIENGCTGVIQTFLWAQTKKSINARKMFKWTHSWTLNHEPRLKWIKLFL